MSTDTTWCQSTPIRFPWRSTFDEELSTARASRGSTASLSVDRHHLGVDRHHLAKTHVLTFDAEGSTSHDTVESTPSQSVDRHSPSIDRHWVRTTPYVLVFPPTTPVYTPPVPFPRKHCSK
ncbi:hypothetical protein ISN44_As06g034350 [Arabidopsis suecica]|uniref:Uncharacterized protein n=1 Tax=Arabidopsis suecica TaxID=45249 RepID=A0A8T2CNR3_ARASU|nr:hypothetical protein ISN44_As06g034350 [Arabidopsis suecica]